MADEQSTGKAFFSTLPGIITAIAGLITAVGGLIIILNKSGNAGAETKGAHQFITPKDSTNESDNSNTTSTFFNYEPKRITHENITYEIDAADAEASDDEMALHVKLRCFNSSDAAYEFHSTYLEAKVGEKKYTVWPYEPSGESQTIPPKGSMPLEFTFSLPAYTKTFSLDFWDGQSWIGSAEFTEE